MARTIGTIGTIGTIRTIGTMNHKNQILVVGSVALDSIETPHGGVEETLGGSATYFSMSASLFNPVELVAVVGDDFPEEYIGMLRERNIGLDGLTSGRGKTFRWRGRYLLDMNTRETLELKLNVFENFRPELPPSGQNAEFVFLANIHPSLQGYVLDNMNNPGFSAMDTIDHWINDEYQDLKRVLKRVDTLIINDAEVRLLGGDYNLRRSAMRILSMGPRRLIVKRGEYGALMFSGDSTFAVPAIILDNVVDPTGAGDCFAGGFMGCLAQEGNLDEKDFRRAVVMGCVLASFCVEGFGVEALKDVRMDDVLNRLGEFEKITRWTRKEVSRYV